MSDKDLTQKALLRLPDVFASLINFLIFDNCPVIHPFHQFIIERN